MTTTYTPNNTTPEQKQAIMTWLAQRDPRHDAKMCAVVKVGFRQVKACFYNTNERGKRYMARGRPAQYWIRFYLMKGESLPWHSSH